MQVDVRSVEEHLEDASFEDEKSTTLRVRPSGSAFCIRVPREDQAEADKNQLV